MGGRWLAAERLISQNKSLYYHFGPQGETRYLTDGNGDIADTYLYTAYGVLLDENGSDLNSHRYGGKYGYYTDGPNGIILAGHRWYHPGLMRWLTRDPIGFEGGDNLYQYVGGNPVRWVDPSGLLDLSLFQPGSADFNNASKIDFPDNPNELSIGGHAQA